MGFFILRVKMQELIKIEKIGDELRVDSRLIAEELGNIHKNVIEMIRRYHPRLEKYGRVAFETIPFETNGGVQNAVFCYLNEKQSTFLVTLSKNSEKAVDLKQKLTDSYFYYKDKQKPSLPSNYKEALIALVAEVEEKEKLEIELKDAQPKIEFHDDLIDSEGLYSGSEAAKIFMTGRTRLFNMLREEKIFMPGSSQPYQPFIDQKYFESKTTEKNGHAQKQTFITPKGLSWLKKKYFSKTMQTSF